MRDGCTDVISGHKSLGLQSGKVNLSVNGYQQKPSSSSFHSSPDISGKLMLMMTRKWCPLTTTTNSYVFPILNWTIEDDRIRLDSGVPFSSLSWEMS